MVHYSTLKPEKNEIRLVTLLPGKSRDEIRCTLSTVSLDSNPKFSALSYVWGDPAETKSITIDGEPFHITVNLEAGLRALRGRWKRRVLWIDAICVNQNDNKEKNIQVPHMGRIYSTAPAVIVWLGPSTPDIKLHISWLKAHSSKFYSRASAYWLILNTRAAVSKYAQQDRDMAKFRALLGFCDLLELPYWSRMWTYQEYQLPRNRPMCFCGDMQPFDLNRIFTDRRGDKLFSKVLHQPLERYSVEGLRMVMEKSESLANRINCVTYQKRHLALSLLTSRAENEATTLAKLLSMTSDRQCSNDRDKIYALYGMVPAALNRCPPDYTKPVTEVMLQVVTYMVNFEDSSIAIWSVFGLRDDRLSEEVRLYPSWMPDFTKTTFIEQPAMNIHLPHQLVFVPILGLHQNSPVLRIDGMTLRLWARSLGTCQIVLHFADIRLRVIEQLIGILQRDEARHRLAKMVGKPEILDSRIARVCVAHGPTKISKMPIEDILTTFQKITDSAFNISGHFELVNAVDELRGKALLVTEDGCFGISVGGAKDEDIVVLPPGLRIPIVLTRELANSAYGNVYYKMVGTAIIEGVTSGGAEELFDEEFVEKVAKRDLVEYLIH